jgi:hypothetical protein
VFPDLLSTDVNGDLTEIEGLSSFVKYNDPPSDSFSPDETSASLYLSSDSDSDEEETKIGDTEEMPFAHTASSPQSESITTVDNMSETNMTVVVDENLVHPFLGTDAELRRLWNDLCAVRERREQLQRHAN